MLQWLCISRGLQRKQVCDEIIEDAFVCPIVRPCHPHGLSATIDEHRIGHGSVVVTFNGSGFDLRFLKNTFPELVLPPIHIDLRWISRRLGYSGGLKELERSLGIARKSEVAQMDGLTLPCCGQNTCAAILLLLKT